MSPENSSYDETRQGIPCQQIIRRKRRRDAKSIYASANQQKGGWILAHKFLYNNTQWMDQQSPSKVLKNFSLRQIQAGERSYRHLHVQLLGRWLR